MLRSATVISVVLAFLFQRTLCNLILLEKRNKKQDFDPPLLLPQRGCPDRANVVVFA